MRYRRWVTPVPFGTWQGKIHGIHEDTDREFVEFLGPKRNTLAAAIADVNEYIESHELDIPPILRPSNDPGNPRLSDVMRAIAAGMRRQSENPDGTVEATVATGHNRPPADAPPANPGQ